MSVATGTRLGPYEVLTLIGARGPRTRVSTLLPNIRHEEPEVTVLPTNGEETRE
jgi:hypothetical protein